MIERFSPVVDVSLRDGISSWIEQWNEAERFQWCALLRSSTDVNSLHVCSDLVGVLSRSLGLMDGGQTTEACL